MHMHLSLISNVLLPLLWSLSKCNYAQQLAADFRHSYNFKKGVIRSYTGFPS